MTEAKNQTESDNEDRSSVAYDLLKSDPRKYFGPHNAAIVYVPEGQGLYVSRLALRKLITDGVADRVRVCSIVAGTTTTCEADNGDSLTLGDLHTELTQATPYGKSHYVKLMVLDKYGVAVNVDDRKVVFYASLTDFVEFCQYLAGKTASESETMQDLRDQITHLKATLDLVDDDRNRTRGERNSSLLTNRELTTANVKLRDENIRLRGLLSDTKDKLKEALKDKEKKQEDTSANEAPVDKDLLRAALIFASRMDSLMLKAVREEPHKPVQNCPTPPKAFTDPANWDIDKATKDDLRELLRFIFNSRDFLSSNGFSVEIPHIPDKIAQAICHPGNEKPAPRVTKELLRHAIGHARRMCSTLAEAQSRLHFKDAPQPSSRLLVALNSNEPVEGDVAVFEDIKTFTLEARVFLRRLGYTGIIPSIHPDLRDEFGREFALENGVKPTQDPLLAKEVMCVARKLNTVIGWGRAKGTWRFGTSLPDELARRLYDDANNASDDPKVTGIAMDYIFRAITFLKGIGHAGDIPEMSAVLRNALASAYGLKRHEEASKDNDPRVLLERAISLAAAFKRTMDTAKTRQPWYDNKRRATGLKQEPVPSKDLEQAFKHPENAGLDVMSDIKCYILRVRIFLAVLEYPGSLPNVHHSLRHVLGKAFTLKDGLRVPELLVEGTTEAMIADNSVAEMRLLMENAPVGAKEVDRLEYIAGNKDKTPLELAALNGLDWKLLNADKLFGDNPSITCTELSRDALTLANDRGVRTSGVAKSILRLRDAAIEGRIPNVAYLSAFLSCMIDLLSSSKKCGRFDMELENVVSEICKAYIAGNVAIGEAVVMMQQIVEHLAAEQTAKEPDNTQANNLLGALLIMSLLRKKPKKKKKK